MNGSSWTGFWLGEIWHPLKGYGYQFWSGIGSDFGEITLIAAVVGSMITAYRLYMKHTECSKTTCKNHGHRVHGTPYYACHEHHPVSMHNPGEDITEDHIAAAHSRISKDVFGR